MGRGGGCERYPEKFAASQTRKKKLKRDAKLNRLPVAKHGGGLLKGRFKRHALALHLGAAVGPAPADGDVLVDSDSD
jgi:hypothetical protein